MIKKYIFVSGGVISGIGKGITTASISKILQSKGFKVTALKIDMYLNVDAGTIRPQEHGEVFVTDDGIETDQDLGNYERFLDVSLTKANYVTTGQVYQEVIKRERSFAYDGEDVEAIPHVTDEIISRIEEAGSANQVQIVIIELGGTVGEYQNALFYEAARIMELRSPEDVLHIHVGYLPIPKNLGEMKSKPIQQSVRMLNSMGVQPDFIIGRSELPLDQRRKDRLALFCNVHPEDVISNPDQDTIYSVPLVLEAQDLGNKVLRKLGLQTADKDLVEWRSLIDKTRLLKNEVKIAVVGKYFGSGDFKLEDVYVSVIEAIKHASWANEVKPRMFWVDSEEFESDESLVHKSLAGMDGVVVPGGFGGRGIEGVMKAIEYARVNKIPYLGLCYGMQLAAIEFARNVLGLKEANTTEVDSDSPHPIIHLMPEQEKKMLFRDYGATMRLGAWDCRLEEGSLAFQAYGKKEISERHRHRYEFNNQYKEKFENHGFVVSGYSPDGKLVEIMELKDHPFFLGTQFHPEFKSHPLNPHPLFRNFIKACLKK